MEIEAYSIFYFSQSQKRMLLNGDSTVVHSGDDATADDRISLSQLLKVDSTYVPMEELHSKNNIQRMTVLNCCATT